MIREAAVYQLFDSRDRLLYVGCSQDPWTRFKSDHAKKPWGRRIARMEVDYFTERAQALVRERELIEEHEPPFNIQFTAFCSINDIEMNVRLSDGRSPAEHSRDAANVIERLLHSAEPLTA